MEDTLLSLINYVPNSLVKDHLGFFHIELKNRELVLAALRIILPCSYYPLKHRTERGYWCYMTDSYMTATNLHPCSAHLEFLMEFKCGKPNNK